MADAAIDFRIVLEAYLHRVGLTSSDIAEGATLKVLKTIQRAQVFTLPFENLDPALSRGVKLDISNVWEKVVHQGRGGYCFELNGLLAAILEKIGFKLRRCIGRVVLSNPPGSRTHMVLIVEVDNKEYLVDAGFGAQALREPLPIADLDTPALQGSEVYKLVNDNAQFYSPTALQLRIWQPMSWQEGRSAEECWRPSYSFDPLEPLFEADIVAGNFFVSNYDGPTNIFTNVRMAILQTEKGFDVLLGKQFKRIIRVATDDLVDAGVSSNVYNDNVKTEVERPEVNQGSTNIPSNSDARGDVVKVDVHTISSDKEWFEVLEKEFQINLSWNHNTGLAEELDTTCFREQIIVRESQQHSVT